MKPIGQLMKGGSRFDAHFGQNPRYRTFLSLYVSALILLILSLNAGGREKPQPLETVGEAAEAWGLYSVLRVFNKYYLLSLVLVVL